MEKSLFVFSLLIASSFSTVALADSRADRAVQKCETRVRSQLHRRLARKNVTLTKCVTRESLTMCEGSADNGTEPGDMSFVTGFASNCEVKFLRITGQE